MAIPLGFVIGMSPLLYRALDPFIQILKPISPLAWMPIALYTIKNANISAIFVIFICSVWPMLVNTAFGVANVRKDWLNLSRTLEDAGTVINPLVPWSVCGVFISQALGVPVWSYLPYAFFCYLSLILTLLFGWTGLTLSKK